MDGLVIMMAECKLFLGKIRMMSNQQRWIECLIAVFLAGVATIWLEHSAIDLMIAKWFYLGDGQRVVDKSAVLPDLIFYTGIKRLLILLELYLLIVCVCRYYQSKNRSQPNPTAKWLKPVQHFSQKELVYLTVTMLMIPMIVGGLKAVTHVACPSYLELFGGDLPYLPMWQSMQLGLTAKCFPAAHASSGFALYAFAFLPSLNKYRIKIALVVTVIAWLMGGYKMLIGDHFISHTIVSMCLAWAICALMAMVFFKKS